MNSYICTNSIFLPIVNSKDKGERIFEGTSMVIVEPGKLKKKNGSRVYSISKEGFEKNFIEEKRYRYYGISNDFLGLKRGKDYLYGGHFIDSNGFETHRIFTKRFPVSEFLELTNEEFNVYFNKEYKFNKSCFDNTYFMLNTLLKKREEFDLKFSRYKDFSPEFYKIKERKSLFITSSKK